MLLEATHRTDNRQADDKDRDPPPFLGFVELPNALVVASRGQAVYRVQGWIVSGRGRPMRLATQVGHGPLVEQRIDQERGDVVAVLGDAYQAASPRCGFSFPLELPGTIGDVDLPVTLQVSDGEFIGRAQFTICHSARPTPRADYKAVWQSVSEEREHAKLAVAGSTDEEEYSRSARQTVERLEKTVGIDPRDVVLEIGAGVGRMGPVLAPRCKRWIATDVSANMLSHARDRCKDLDNIEYVEISGWNLAPITTASVDVVYCTVVFMHLDEWERFSYVREAMRVLRPGGRLYVDNINLESEPGWEIFIGVLNDLHPLERPPNVSKTSTPEELRAYLERAGFVAIKLETPLDQWWVAAYGRAPG